MSFVTADTVIGFPVAPPGQRTGDLATKDNNAIGAEVVWAKGCAKPGDGGGGMFYWDPDCKQSDDDGGTIIVPPGNNGGWKREFSGPLSVRWFGAQGDGKWSNQSDNKSYNPGNYATHIKATDDTVAFQAWLNAASSFIHPQNPGLGLYHARGLYLDPGLYLVTSNLQIHPGTSIRGAGYRRSLIWGELPATNEAPTDHSNSLLYLGLMQHPTGATEIELRDFGIIGGENPGFSAVEFRIFEGVIDLHVSGGWQWMMHGTGPGPAGTFNFAGIVGSKISLRNTHQDWSLIPASLPVPDPRGGIYVKGWVNGSSIYAQIRGIGRKDAGGDAVRIAGTYSAANDFDLSGVIEGVWGAAVRIDGAGTNVHIHDLHCENNLKGKTPQPLPLIDITGHSNVSIGHNVSSDVKLHRCPNVSIEKLNGTLSLDRDCINATIKGTVTGLVHHGAPEMVTISPPLDYNVGGRYSATGFTSGDDENLVLNGDFHRFISPAVPCPNIAPVPCPAPATGSATSPAPNPTPATSTTTSQPANVAPATSTTASQPPNVAPATSTTTTQAASAIPAPGPNPATPPIPPPSPNNIWGTYGCYMAEQCGDDRPDSTRTFYSSHCAKIMNCGKEKGVIAFPVLGKRLAPPSNRCPDFSKDNVPPSHITISFKWKIVQGKLSAHLTRADKTDQGPGEQAKEYSFACENGFSRFVGVYKITQDMIDNGAALQIHFPETGSEIYISELQAAFGIAAPRNFVARTMDHGGTIRLDGGLLHVHSQAPQSGDPIFGCPWQVGDQVINAMPVAGMPLGWICTRAGTGDPAAKGYPSPEIAPAEWTPLPILL